jgi:hypothetical protein
MAFYSSTSLRWWMKKRHPPYMAAANTFQVDKLRMSTLRG